MSELKYEILDALYEIADDDSAADDVRQTAGLAASYIITISAHNEMLRSAGDGA